MTYVDKTRPDPRRAERPWAIVGVSDEKVPAFGYTNGLADLYQHPELWMGSEAANDPLVLQWCVVDIAHWLNDLADRVRDGAVLKPGDVVRVDEPHHDLVLEFTIGEPADRHDLEALLIEPWALVMPVTWTATWLGALPPWPRTPEGALLCPCQPIECEHCVRENRAARRARGKRR
jgi:hypothetical protein